MVTVAGIEATAVELVTVFTFKTNAELIRAETEPLPLAFALSPLTGDQVAAVMVAALTNLVSAVPSRPATALVE
jgi:hypothetical protein